MSDANLTPRQQKWFASVRASLERETGKTLAEWAAIARACPETGQRARLKWLKDEHGLLQNRAMHVLHEAFPPDTGWEDAAALTAALWRDPAAEAIRAAIHARALALGEVTATARKSFSAWSRTVQFAAARPLKDGGAMLGLAVATDVASRLEAPRHESWSERLTARLRLASAAEVDESLAVLLRAAWEGA